MHLQYSYENFQDNPIMKDRRRISRQAKNKVEYTMPNKINKPRAVPPRSSIEPIPTPRKSSAGRSREQSREKEPYYKQPPSNKPVVKQKTSREPVHSHHDKARNRQRPKQAAYSSSSGSDSQSEQSDTYAVIDYSDNHYQAAKKENLSGKSELRGMKADIQKKATPRHKQQESQRRRSLKYSELSDDSEYEKIAKKASRPEKSLVRQAAIADSKIKSKNNTKSTNDCRVKHSVKKQETEESKKSTEEKLYKSSKIPILQAKSKQSKHIQERSPKKTRGERETNKSKQEPVKKSRDDLAKINHSKQHNSSWQARSENSISSKSKNPAVTAAAVKRDLGGLSTYTPMEMPLQRPDWFEEAAASKPKEPRPKSIVDGVLYTSR